MAVHAEQPTLGGLEAGGGWGRLEPSYLEAPSLGQHFGGFSGALGDTVVYDPFGTSLEAPQAPADASSGGGYHQARLAPSPALNDAAGLVPQLYAAAPPPPPPRVDQFKTRLCVYLNSGSCPHGARCLFAHSVEELRAAPSHRSGIEYKTKLCRYSLADCPFAAVGRCQFAHSVDELRAPGGGHAASARRFKTRLCKYHMAGHCPYAATNTCQFAHSEEELRSPPPSTWRQLEGGWQTEPDDSKTGARDGVASGASHRVVVLAAQQRPSGGAGGGGGGGEQQSGAALRAALEQKRFTRLCKYYLAGHCPFAASGTCQFAHSTSELRRRSPTPPQPSQPRKASPQRAPGHQRLLPVDQPRESTTEASRPVVHSIADLWTPPAFGDVTPDWSFQAAH